MLENDVEIGTIVFQKVSVKPGRKISELRTAFEIVSNDVIQGKIQVVRCMCAQDFSGWGPIGTKGEAYLDSFLTSEEFKKACEGD